MGFFSAECVVCHRSILSPYALDAELDPRLAEVTAITPDGARVAGTHDGYGRIDTGARLVEDGVGFDTMVFHTACWDTVGRPTTYRGPSSRAHDQGYFLDVDRYRGWTPAVDG